MDKENAAVSVFDVARVIGGASFASQSVWDGRFGRCAASQSSALQRFSLQALWLVRAAESPTSFIRVNSGV
jgi:hypothetical protein